MGISKQAHHVKRETKGGKEKERPKGERVEKKSVRKRNIPPKSNKDPVHHVMGRFIAT